jgi:hypothetical protein
MRRILLVSALALASCQALSHTQEFKHRPTEMGDKDGPDTRRKWEPCARMDDGSREYACDIKATFAVKEEEVKDKAGPMWLMGLYR